MGKSTCPVHACPSDVVPTYNTGVFTDIYDFENNLFFVHTRVSIQEHQDLSNEEHQVLQ